jgi:hypothetical protein
MQKAKDKISISEITLLKCLNYEINVSLPNDFIIVYAGFLYPDNEDDIMNYAQRIANDSFYTYAPLLYKNYVVALASIVIAAKFLALPAFTDKSFRHLENMKNFHIQPITEEDYNRRILGQENISFHKDLIDNKSKESFEKLEWWKKVHPFLEKEDLMQCVNYICEFYEDCKKIAIKQESKP